MEPLSVFSLLFNLITYNSGNDINFKMIIININQYIKLSRIFLMGHLKIIIHKILKNFKIQYFTKY